MGYARSATPAVSSEPSLEEEPVEKRPGRVELPAEGAEVVEARRRGLHPAGAGGRELGGVRTRCQILERPLDPADDRPDRLRQRLPREVERDGVAAEERAQ